MNNPRIMSIKIKPITSIKIKPFKCFLDQDNYTALHIAAKEGHEEVASVLLEHGASLGKQSGGETSALQSSRARERRSQEAS